MSDTTETPSSKGKSRAPTNRKVPRAKLMKQLQAAVARHPDFGEALHGFATKTLKHEPATAVDTALWLSGTHRPAWDGRITALDLDD